MKIKFTKEGIEFISGKEKQEIEELKSPIKKEELGDVVNAAITKERFPTKALVFINRNGRKLGNIMGTFFFTGLVFLDVAPSVSSDILNYYPDWLQVIRHQTSPWLLRTAYPFLTYAFRGTVSIIAGGFTPHGLKHAFNSKNTQNLLKEATQYDKKQEYDKVEEKLIEAVRRIPVASLLHYYVGRINNKMDRLQFAVESYRRAIQLHKERESQDTYLLENMANVFKENKTAMRKDPNKVGPYIDEAVLHYIKGNTRKARKFFERSLQIGGEIKEIQDLYTFFYETTKLRKLKKSLKFTVS